MGFERVGVDAVGDAPDGFEQIFAGHGLCARGNKLAQQRAFFLGEGDGLPTFVLQPTCQRIEHPAMGQGDALCKLPAGEALDEGVWGNGAGEAVITGRCIPCGGKDEDGVRCGGGCQWVEAVNECELCFFCLAGDMVSGGFNH